jgi:hypothetical protein
MPETVITVVIPDGSEDEKQANVLLRRGDNARIKSIRFSTLADIAQAMHDLSLEVQEIEFAAPAKDGAKKATRKKSNYPIAPVGAPATTEAVAAEFAVKQMTLF